MGMARVLKAFGLGESSSPRVFASGGNVGVFGVEKRSILSSLCRLFSSYRGRGFVACFAVLLCLMFSGCSDESQAPELMDVRERKETLNALRNQEVDLRNTIEEKKKELERIEAGKEETLMHCIFWIVGCGVVAFGIGAFLGERARATSRRSKKTAKEEQA